MTTVCLGTYLAWKLTTYLRQVLTHSLTRSFTELITPNSLAFEVNPLGTGTYQVLTYPGSQVIVPDSLNFLLQAYLIFIPPSFKGGISTR